jgi:hypothetical protein
MFELFMQAAGAGLKSAAAISQANSDSAILNSQAGFYERQAALEDEKADYDVARHREATQRVLGRQRAAYGAMGFTMRGTPTDIAFDTINESEKDVYAIRWSALVRQQNYQAEADNARAKAGGVERAGVFNAIAPWVGIGTKLAGGSSFGSSFGSTGAGWTNGAPQGVGLGGYAGSN